MYKKSVRRRRAVLLLLIVLSITLLTVNFREPASGGLHAVQRGVMEAISPLQRGVSRALKPARDLVDWTGEVFDAKSENKRLKRRLDELQTELAALSTAQRDNQELRGLLELRDSGVLPSTYSRATARVITRSPTLWYSTVTINKGSSNGVRVDQPVVNSEGLIGHVTAVSADVAQVMLITDHRSAVSAQVVPDGPTGVVRPRVGSPSDLVLDFVQRGKKIRAGAFVVTAGWRSGRLESLFPRGIPIGRITEAPEQEVELFQRAHLRPFADLRQTDIVQVLRKR